MAGACGREVRSSSRRGTNGESFVGRGGLGPYRFGATCFKILRTVIRESPVRRAMARIDAPCRHDLRQRRRVTLPLAVRSAVFKR